MAEPFLDLGDIGLVGESISGGSSTQRVHTQAIDLSPDASLKPIFLHNVTVDRVGIERAVEFTGDALGT